MHISIVIKCSIILITLHYQTTFRNISYIVSANLIHCYVRRDLLTLLIIDKYIVIWKSQVAILSATEYNVHLMFFVPKYRSAISDQFTSDADLDA